MAFVPNFLFPGSSTRRRDLRVVCSRRRSCPEWARLLRFPALPAMYPKPLLPSRSRFWLRLSKLRHARPKAPFRSGCTVFPSFYLCWSVPSRESCSSFCLGLPSGLTTICCSRFLRSALSFPTASSVGSAAVWACSISGSVSGRPSTTTNNNSRHACGAFPSIPVSQPVRYSWRPVPLAAIMAAATCGGECYGFSREATKDCSPTAQVVGHWARGRNKPRNGERTQGFLNPEFYLWLTTWNQRQ